MAKKSLHSDDSNEAKAYELMQFDAPVRKVELDPAEINARIKAREEEGYRKGHSAGYEKGLHDAENEVQQKLAGIARIEGIITELEHYRQKKVDELMPEIIDLSMEVARRIIFREIKIDRTIIMDVAEDAVKRVGEQEDGITIKVNPLDYELMITAMESLKERSGLKNILVEPAAAVTSGGCYIETQTGEIDARVEEKIKEVENALDTATNSEV